MQNVDAVRPSHAVGNPTSVPENPRMRISVDQKSLQQLLREEMRLSLLSKRHARGRSAAKLDCPEPLVHEMNVADLERKERRREQNRRAAQRCRRKKRMNQVSVLQNYEWIVSRNQTLQQEVNQLRQEMTRLTSVLKAHRNACTCLHVHKGPLHVHTANVKLEPGEDSPGPEAGYRTPPPPLHPPAPLPHPSPVSVSRCLPLSSCQYETPVNENMVVNEVSASALSQQYSASSVQVSNEQQASFYASPVQPREPSFLRSVQANGPRNVSCESPENTQVASHACPTSFPIPAYGCDYQAQDRGRQRLGGVDSRHSVLAMEEADAGAHAAVHGQGRLREDFRGAVPMAACGPGQAGRSPPQHPPALDPDSPFALLEDLAGITGGMGACVFQAEAATPLSADGRRSISSVASDVSRGSEPHSHDVFVRTENPPPAPASEYHVTDDLTPHDLSQLLSQINHSELLFHQEGGVDEVFLDQVVGVAALQDHFLHSL